MKQGAGRLLRDQDDYGVIVLCDPRITTKSYGRVFLRSFEPMPSTSSIDDVAQFLSDRVSKGAVA
jgi:ATP-dependent DNA helicase DinG